jgi:hypothetical protein
MDKIARRLLEKVSLNLGERIPKHLVRWLDILGPVAAASNVYQHSTCGKLAVQGFSGKH